MSAEAEAAKAIAGPIGIGLAVLLVGGVVYYFGKKEIAKGAAAAGNAVNPVSDQNVFYKGVNAVGTVLSGDPEFTLGGWVYDVLHPTASGQPTTPPNSTSTQTFWTYKQQVGDAANQYADLLNSRSFFVQ